MRASTRERIVITGAGAVTPAGVGWRVLIEALGSGRSCLADLRQPWALPPYQLGARVDELGARERIPPRRLRRLGRISRMALVAASEAVEGAGLKGEAAGVGAVLGTGLGALEDSITFIGQLQDGDPSGASPGIFPTTVMNVATAHLSMELGLRGFNTTVNHKEISGEMAVLVAADALRLGHARIMVAGGVDELSPSAHHGYRRLGALARGAPRPYRCGRDGVALGEGACMVVMEGEEQARRREARVIAELAGVGAAGCSRPPSSWGMAAGDAAREASVRGGVRAVNAALLDAELSVEEVDLVVGCGCGSPELDLLESQVIGEVFGDRPVPLTSPHGGLGTWMAGGGLRLLGALGAISTGQIFPTITTGEVDPEIGLPGLVTAVGTGPVRNVLVCSHATGGGSVALVVRGAPS